MDATPRVAMPMIDDPRRGYRASREAFDHHRSPPHAHFDSHQDEFDAPDDYERPSPRRAHFDAHQEDYEPREGLERPRFASQRDSLRGRPAMQDSCEEPEEAYEEPLLPPRRPSYWRTRTDPSYPQIDSMLSYPVQAPPRPRFDFEDGMMADQERLRLWEQRLRCVYPSLLD